MCLPAVPPICIYYTLPKTAITVTIPVTKVTLNKGIFSDWATGLLLRPYTDAEKTTFEVGQPSFETSAVPDADNVYLVGLKGTPFQKRTLELQLNELGFLTDATSEVEDKTIEYLVRTVEVVASVVSKTRLPIPAPEPEEATVAKARIKQIRYERLALLSGQRGTREIAPDSLNIMLKRLDDEEKSLVALFQGTINTKTWVAKFTMEDPPQASLTLFNVSPDDGVTLSTDANVPKPLFPLPNDFVNGKGTKGDDLTFAVKSSDSSQHIQGMINTAHALKKGMQGYYYRVPGPSPPSSAHRNVRIEGKNSYLGRLLFLLFPLRMASRRL